MQHNTNSRRLVLLFASVVAIFNAGLWLWINHPLKSPYAVITASNVRSFHGIAYSPYQRWDDPAANKVPSDGSIESDIAWLAKQTSQIRTYTSAQFQEIPRLAEKYSLKVTQGVLLNGNDRLDQLELQAAIRQANTQRSISRVIAGNETILKGTLTLSSLTQHLSKLRAAIKQPVSTAEPWHIWLANPELATAVDFITVHLLPYWEGIDEFNAVGHALYQLDQVKKRFPTKAVLIGEVGWPSAGDTIGQAIASPANQAAFIREFLAKSAGNDGAVTPYFIMEAFDQPWKQAEEGKAGGYWGLADANRQIKFSLNGPVERDPYWSYKALVSSFVGFALVLLCLPKLGHLRRLAQFSFAAIAQFLVAGVVTLITLPLFYYLQISDWLALIVLVPTLLVMLAILLAHAFEFVELFWEGGLRRQFHSQAPALVNNEPLVSIHLACCNEPPSMVIATLNSLLALNYKNFEILVIDNNTRSVDLWKPVHAFVEHLGDTRVKFYHLPTWPGYKAGALNFALANTNPLAEIVGVVDADYVVKPEWLACLVGYFERSEVGIVQAPQAHREWGKQVFRRMMNWEYDGFFRIGMHHRNERDAIVQHGTMTLIRAQALREHGAWDEACVCEDTELGLRLIREGWETIYVDRVMGEGLTPDTFAAYKKQRQRWAEGAMQILKKHQPALLKPSQLSLGQRYHFLAGWLPWIGDTLHLVFALLAIIWTIGALAYPSIVSVPTVLFMVPLATFVFAKLCVGPLLYWQRVPCTVTGIAGASIAGMAVAHAVARGVIAGLLRKKTAFVITAKGQSTASKTSAWQPIRQEILLLTALTVSAFAFLLFGPSSQKHWSLMLILQALPYAAACLCTWLSLRPEKMAQSDALASKIRPPSLL